MTRSNGKPQRRDSKVLSHILSKVFEKMVTRKASLSDENNLINFPAIKHWVIETKKSDSPVDTSQP